MAKKRTSSTGIGSLLAIAGVAFVIYLAGNSGSMRSGGTNSFDDGERQEIETAVSEMRDRADELLDPSQVYEPQPARSESMGDDAPRARGEFGEIEGLMKRFMTRLQEGQDRYLSELDAIGWTEILEPNRIRDLVRTGEWRQIVERAHVAVDFQEERMHQILDEYRREVQSMNVSEELRSSMVDGFDRGMERAQEKHDATFSLEREIIDAVEDIYSFLDDVDRKDWAIENGQPVFSYDWQVDTYNKHFNRIDSAIAEQAQIVQAARDEVIGAYSEIERQFDRSQ